MFWTTSTYKCTHWFRSKVQGKVHHHESKIRNGLETNRASVISHCEVSESVLKKIHFIESVSSFGLWKCNKQDISFYIFVRPDRNWTNIKSIGNGKKGKCVNDSTHTHDPQMNISLYSPNPNLIFKIFYKFMLCRVCSQCACRVGNSSWFPDDRFYYYWRQCDWRTGNWEENEP